MKIKISKTSGNGPPMTSKVRAPADLMRAASGRLKWGRINGNENDCEGLQIKEMPGDGSYKWLEGKLRDDGNVCGHKRPDEYYYYKVEYTTGPKDVEWFCQIDCNYLSRLERERNLKAKEPAVWALRELDRARGKNVDDIRTWWRGYIFPNGPNGKFYDDKVLGRLLDAAPSIFVGKLLAADLVQHLPLGNKSFEGGLLNIIRGYLGVKIIKPDIDRLAQPTLSASRVPASKRGIFPPEHYERKDAEVEKAAESSPGLE